MVGITRTEATHISVVFSAGLTNVQLRIQATCFQTFVKSSILDCNIQGGAMEGVIEPHFTCLFVDEAAQATKPETLIPLSVVAGRSNTREHKGGNCAGGRSSSAKSQCVQYQSCRVWIKDYLPRTTLAATN
jgi:hypothetical protein